jgi:alpha-tubulin suppressor-like RCC1 family protein
MPLRTQVLWRRLSLRASLGTAAIVCIALAACSGESPLAPHPASPKSSYSASAIACSYSHGDPKVLCAEYAHSDSRTLAGALATLRQHAPPTAAIGVLRPTGSVRTAMGSRDVYFGQQGVDVFVGTDSVTYDGSSTFKFMATIQNLSTEPLGSADGRTPSSDSIIVFFSLVPVVTSGTGSITVEDVAGTNTFTASNQPYYEYPGLLPSNGTSVPVAWVFGLPPTVMAFNFDVYVAAQVPDTGGGALTIPAHAFDSLAVGEAHTCAIRPGNHEYCWGFNAYGAMGTGESGPATTPRGVLGNLSMQTITSGSEFSCALAAGGAYCWGDNTSGEVGDGSTTDRGEPALTTSPSGSFSEIAAGTDFSCGVAGGTTYCWGDDYTGQLGTGAMTLTLQTSPQALASGAPQFTRVVTGAAHACGLTASNTAYCWGANADGELGTGNNISTASPTVVSTSVMFSSLVAGTNFTCGLDMANNAFCWGANVYGSLGTGAAGASANTPQPVTGGLHFTKLTAGGYHACGITSSGAAYCWGGNNNGQLGNGTTTDNATPQPVSGAFAFTAIGAGFAHTCALVSGGATYCWGDNSSGQVGDGTFNQRPSPTAVLLP